MSHGVVEDAGRFVAVGDVFTDNQHQRAGLSPSVWTSPDGTTWTRNRVDLGNGADPYFSNLVVRQADSSSRADPKDRYPRGCLDSRDLTHWNHHTITPKGFARIEPTPHGYVAFGGTSVGTIKSPAYRPALWQSPDGRHWHRTLRLASGTIGSSFSFVGTVGETIIAVGAHSDDGGQTSTPFLYRVERRADVDTHRPERRRVPVEQRPVRHRHHRTVVRDRGLIPANDNTGVSGSVFWTTNGWSTAIWEGALTTFAPMTYHEFFSHVVDVVEGDRGGRPGARRARRVRRSSRTRLPSGTGSTPTRPTQNLGRVILLGLEVLIIADIIRTIVIDQSLESVGAGAIVLIRSC